MARNNWYYSNQIAQLSTLSTISNAPGCDAVPTGDVALTATHDLEAGDWMVVWSCDAGHVANPYVDSTTRVKFCVAIGAGAPVEKQVYRVVTRVNSGRRQCMAFAFLSGLSAGNHTFSVRYGLGTGTEANRRAQIRRIHQFVVKMNGVPGAENSYTETLAFNDRSFDATYADVASLTFTPTRANDTWIILANLDAGPTTVSTDNGFVRLLLDGVEVTNREARIHPSGITAGEKYPYWVVAARSLTAASHTVKIQARAATALDGFIVGFRRILAFNLSRWPIRPVVVQESEGEETFNAADSSFQTKTNPLNYTPVVKSDHAWICGWLNNFVSSTENGQNESHVGTPTDTEKQLRDDQALVTTDYSTQGLLHVLDGASITPGTSPGAMEDRVRWVSAAFDIKTKGYSGFVLRRPRVMDPVHSGGTVVPGER